MSELKPFDGETEETPVTISNFPGHIREPVDPHSSTWASIAGPFAYFVFALVAIVVIAPFVLLTLHNIPSSLTPKAGIAANDPAFVALREWNKEQHALIGRKLFLPQ